MCSYLVPEREEYMPNYKEIVRLKEFGLNIWMIAKSIWISKATVLNKCLVSYYAETLSQHFRKSWAKHAGVFNGILNNRWQHVLDYGFWQAHVLRDSRPIVLDDVIIIDFPYYFFFTIIGFNNGLILLPLYNNYFQWKLQIRSKLKN